MDLCYSRADETVRASRGYLNFLPKVEWSEDVLRALRRAVQVCKPRAVLTLLDTFYKRARRITLQPSLGGRVVLHVRKIN